MSKVAEAREDLDDNYDNDTKDMTALDRDANHETTSASALQTLIEMHVEELSLDNPVRTSGDDFKCWQKEGRQNYAKADRLNETYYDTYGREVKPLEGERNWRDKETSEERTFSIQLSNGAGVYRRDECLDAFKPWWMSRSTPTQAASTGSVSNGQP
ncbi:hypothetical protein AJ80_04200 [Polytolypa hystricis UAMH7299]|uniref:Uncharacterized protein n=1 Tax=Polytolypa hystricis (strain UAMH7299) TaxID=1447883 RepID=A0A2B7YE19_POLH7|nr:hypothetical protein AJ80_04200 [Polytolypa hystricis UAMH7299]